MRVLGTIAALVLLLHQGVAAYAAPDPSERGLPPTELQKRQFDQAARWYELAELYYYGDLVEQSYEKAAELYRMAAERGHADAQFSLGYMYSQGLGVERNQHAALDWFRRSAQAGQTLAIHNLAYYYDVGLVVAPDDAEAVRLYRLAVEGGDVEAMTNLAIMLDEGRGTIADPAMAAWYLVQAFRLGAAASEEWLFDFADQWAVNTRREIQRILLEAGFYHGPLDGSIDEDIHSALRAYRQAR